MGGLGLFSLEDNLIIANLTQFYRTLTSLDDTISSCAFSQLTEVVRAQQKIEDPTYNDLESFLNSPISAEERTRRDIKSLWTDVRLHLTRTNLKVQLAPNNVNLTAPEDVIIPNN